MRVVWLGFTGVAQQSARNLFFSCVARPRQVWPQSARSRTHFFENFTMRFFALPRMTRGNNHRVFIGNRIGVFVAALLTASIGDIATNCIGPTNCCDSHSGVVAGALSRSRMVRAHV